MHEFTYGDRVLQSVLEYMNSQGMESVREVKLEVGELLGLTNTSLTLAYNTLAKGTKAEGSLLRIRHVKGLVSCPKCGFAGGLNPGRTRHVVDPAFACPKCGSPLTIKVGNECKILEIK